MIKKSKTEQQEDSAIELLSMHLSLEVNPLCNFVKEYKFCKQRDWKIDFYWEEYKLAAEIEGGIFINGRHVRPIGFINDKEKYNEMTMMDISLLRFITSEVKEGKALKEIKRWFISRKII